MNLQILEPSQVLAIENQLQLNYLMDPKQGKESSERPLKQTLSKKEQETGEQFVTKKGLQSLLAKMALEINNNTKMVMSVLERLQAKINASEQRLSAKIKPTHDHLSVIVDFKYYRVEEEKTESTKQRLKEKIKKLQGKLGVVYNQLCQKLVKALEFIQQLLADLEKTQQRLTQAFDERLNSIQQKVTKCLENLQYLIREVPQSDRNFVGELNQAKKDIQELRSQVDVLKTGPKVQE